MCQRLGNIQPDELLGTIEHLPSQKRMEELEAKVSFLQEKTKKANKELKEEKEAHRRAVDKLNLSLAFNRKLEDYVGNTGDVVNKAQLFDANLAQHPVTAKKVIPVLVDFADKMEELLDEMRVLFDGLLPEVGVEKLGFWCRKRGSRKRGSPGGSTPTYNSREPPGYLK